MRALDFKLTLAHDEFSARILEVADEEQVATVAEIDPAVRFGPTPAGRGETQEGAGRSEARGDLAGGATQGLEGSPEMTLTAPSPDDIRRQQDTAERADVEEVSRNEARARIDAKQPIKSPSSGHRRLASVKVKPLTFYSAGRPRAICALRERERD